MLSSALEATHHMMPKDKDEYWSALRRWSNNDADAAAFLDIICRAARLADDIADNDSPNVHEDMAHLLHLVMVQLPLNPFFARNAQLLATPISESILNWVASEAWRKTGDRKQQMFAFVMRESTDRIGVVVALLTGGYKAARQAVDNIYELTERGKTETLEDWLSEEH